MAYFRRFLRLGSESSGVGGMQNQQVHPTLLCASYYIGRHIGDPSLLRFSNSQAVRLKTFTAFHFFKKLFYTIIPILQKSEER